jgi:hypothetical protein
MTDDISAGSLLDKPSPADLGAVSVSDHLAPKVRAFIAFLGPQRTIISEIYERLSRKKTKIMARVITPIAIRIRACLDDARSR